MEFGSMGRIKGRKKGEEKEEIRKAHRLERAAHFENKNKTWKEAPRCFLCETKCDFLVEPGVADELAH